MKASEKPEGSQTAALKESELFSLDEAAWDPSSLFSSG